MNPQLLPLIELQKLDLRIADLKERRRKIPGRLDSVEAPVRDARRLLQEASASIDSLTKERRSQEKDLEAHEDRIAKMRDRAAQLKTNQEYQAHLFEVELANKKKGEIEERILLVMEQVEQAQKVSAEAKSQLGQAEGAFARRRPHSTNWTVRLRPNWLRWKLSSRSCPGRSTRPCWPDTTS